MKISRANNGRIKAYTYDSIGNIIRVNSSYPMPQYQLTERYSCDSADQLLTAESTCNNNVLCSGAYSYNNWGKINTYTQQTTDPATNMSENKDYRCYFPGSSADMAQGQTSFAPIIKYDMQQNPQPLETLTFGINGSLRKRTVQSLSPYTEYYLFNSAANLKAYSNNTLDFAYYGYNVSNTRTYKLSMLNQNQWINGQSQPLDLHIQHAMFYPNAYLNFNQNGEYTKHYYNGTERIASRLGSSTQPTDATSNDRLEYRMMREEEKFRENIQELVSEWHPVDLHGSVALVALQPTGTATDIFYYHTNHLGSTAFVTDQNQNITQGFLYAPFGEITTEYAPMWQNGTLPKYAFNAKELDEETGMYYYEARYYKPPVFTSRDRLFEKYSWTSPYGYCMNNPIKFVDPSGDSLVLLNNRTIATKIINDLNAIYKAKYNVDNAFYLNEYKKDGKNCYRIGASENFDWNKDEYTKAMKECIDDPVKVYIKMVPNNNPEKPTLSRGRKVNDFVKDLGGGSTEGKYVYLSDALPTYASLENKKSEHCLGGITLHEILYHLHKVGVQDDKAVSTGGSELMQMHYGLKISRPHGSGSQHCFPSKPKLNSKKL